jgi:hypothetical protein
MLFLWSGFQTGATERQFHPWIGLLHEQFPSLRLPRHDRKWHHTEHELAQNDHVISTKIYTPFPIFTKIMIIHICYLISFPLYFPSIFPLFTYSHHEYSQFETNSNMVYQLVNPDDHDRILTDPAYRLSKTHSSHSRISTYL